MDLLPAILLGFFGSFHCIGMCGAIAISLANQPDGFTFVLGRLLYNIGRVTTYGLLGFIFGTIGTVIHIAGMQQTLSILIGILILLYVLIPKKYLAKVQTVPIVMYCISTIKKVVSPLFTDMRLTQQYVIGVLNGFLPCGFVYMGLAGALQQTSTLDGSLYMVFFGLGTIPAMLMLTLSSRFFTFQKKIHIRRLIPYGASLMAVLFILRGMSIGIPYFSPVLPANVEVLSNIKNDGHCVPPKK